MRGHEYIREAIRTHLEQSVPARLTAHLTANSLTSPSVADLRFLLADGLQDINDFPAIIVRSTDSEDDTRTADGTWRIVYDIEVIVACDHRVHGDAEAASKDRDRVCWRCASASTARPDSPRTSTSARVNGLKRHGLRPRRRAPGFRWPPAR